MSPSAVSAYAANLPSKHKRLLSAYFTNKLILPNPGQVALVVKHFLRLHAQFKITPLLKRVILQLFLRC